jgi:hypothetical protein
VSRSSPEPEGRALHLAKIRERLSGQLWFLNQGMSSVAYNELMDMMSILQYNNEQRVAGEYRGRDRRVAHADRRLCTRSSPDRRFFVGERYLTRQG